MPKAKCPSCATVVTYTAGYDPICPTCGFRGAAPAPPPPPAQWQAVPGPAASTAPRLSPLPPQPAFAAPPAKQQGLAVAALVCGLLAFPFPPASLVAIILGGIAMSQADRDPANHGGKGMAVAGLVLGIVVAVFWLIVLSAFDWFWDEFW